MKTKRSLPTFCLAEDGELPDLGLPVVVSIEEAFTMRFRVAAVVPQTSAHE